MNADFPKLNPNPGEQRREASWRQTFAVITAFVAVMALLFALIAVVLAAFVEPKPSAVVSTSQMAAILTAIAAAAGGASAFLWSGVAD